jgi:hypothetical protein
MNPEKGLAANNRLNKAAFPAVLLIILIIICFKTIDSSVSGTAITLLTVIYLVLIVLLIQAYKSRDIYYDKSNLYLKGANEVSAVPLSNIRKIKMTLNDATVMGLKFYQYKIEYRNDEDVICEISFWTTAISSGIDEFEKDVKEINPYLKVEHFATS